jgi:uncharacterized membrane protein (UPF0136 family)
MIDPLAYLVRFLHIGSAVVLLGGIFYAWNLSKSGKLSGNPADGFQPSMLISVLLLLASGLYQLMTRTGGGVPKFYHMIFGIKFLLFLHIAAVCIILVKPQTTPEKRARLLTGLAFSGIGVLLLGTALRSLGN